MDDLTPLAEGATTAHELFISYVNAGFTRAEALQIILAIMINGIRQQRKQEDGT